MATGSSVLAWRIQGMGSLVGCRLWGRTESDMTEVTQQQQQQSIESNKYSISVHEAMKQQESCHLDVRGSKILVSLLPLKSHRSQDFRGQSLILVNNYLGELHHSVNSASFQVNDRKLFGEISGQFYELQIANV